MTTATRTAAFYKNLDKPVLVAFGFIIVLLFAGSLYDSNFLSLTYLLQQLQVASFLGIIASGVMHILIQGGRVIDPAL